ncbi:hypothetical protein ACFL96_08040 [Thermoproteota archaeon]
MAPQFYQEHIPQSAYRNLKEKKEKNEDYVLDLELPNLHIEDELSRNALIKKITDEAGQMVKALVSEEKSKLIINSDYLNPILKTLGLM